MFTRRLFTSLSLIALCAVPPLSPAIAANEPRCCDRLSEAKFLDLRSGQPYASVVEDKNDTFDFPKGFSPIAAFQLPNPGASRLVVTTRLTGWRRSTLQLLCPTLTFLDANFEPLASSEPQLAYRSNFFSGANWHAEVEIDPAAKYVVLHTTATTIGRMMLASESSTPGFAFFNGKSYSYVPGRAGPEAYPCANTGKFELELR
jgi:hypothetical protein